MASLGTSHASIGDSTLKNARDLTNSFLGGPEDFTLNLIDHLRCNNPIFENRNPEQPTDSSTGGPEDFTADIVGHANGRKSEQSLRGSEGQVIAILRRSSNVSRKAPQCSLPHSPSHSPPSSTNRRPNSASDSRRMPSLLEKLSLPQTPADVAGANKRANQANTYITVHDGGNMSTIVRDGNVHHKTVRAGVRPKMQPSVSADDGEEAEAEAEAGELCMDDTESLPLSLQDHSQLEPTMSLPLPLVEDDLTKPLGESTPKQQSLNSPPSSHDSTLEKALDFATSLAHRIQRTPASVKNAEAMEYSINLSADASALLPDAIYRPQTFPHNDSFVRNCSDPNVAFADRIRGIRPDHPSTTQEASAPSKDDETELLHQQLEAMQTALAQKDETIAVLQAKLSAKEAQCVELQDALQNHSSALVATETRETALKQALGEAEAESAAAARTAAERFAIVKDALLVAEEEAAVAVGRAKDIMTAAEARANAAISRCQRLDAEVKKLTTSERAARAEAERARKEQAEREALWTERSEVLLAECDRRGRALMVKIGELELPGIRDERGRQAYRYQNERALGRVDVVR